MKQADLLVGSILSLGMLIHPLPAGAQGKPEITNDSPVVILDDPEPDPEDPMAQVTSVSQLSDVKPTDWAFQALQSLVEHYGVIQGYPDGTFRGDRPLTRYEFVATLKLVMEKIAATPQTNINSEDLRSLRRLETDYASDLADLDDRLNLVNSRLTQNQARQFSPTTKLDGQVISTVTDGSNAHTTIVSRVRLNLLTSFRPEDLFYTRLEMGNNGDDAINRFHRKGGVNLLGTAGLLADGGSLDYTQIDQTVKLARLQYTFRPQSNLAVTIGARMAPRDFIDSNRYANNEAVDFGSSFFTHNPLIVQSQIDRPAGAGAAVTWHISQKLNLKALYIAADANLPNQAGLFKDRYQDSYELEFSPNSQWALRLQYTNAQINHTDINAFGVNGEYSLNSQFGFFGRFGTASYEGFNTALSKNLDLHPWTWAVGVTTRNFLVPGTSAGLAIGQPFITGGLGNATQTNFEGFANIKVSDNLSITPAVMLVNNPNNSSSAGTVWEETLRTTFSF